MYDLRIDIDTLKVRGELGRLAARQLPFAIALALNETAKRVHAGERAVMRQRFDRPTPFTMNSLRIWYANKNNPRARVGFRDFAGKGTPATVYLQPQVHGGERSHKRFEKALIWRGIMDRDEYAVPASGARLDSYGNMSRGQIVQILSALQAFREVGYLANRSSSRRSQRKAARADYFAGNPGGEGRGVWQRVKTGWGDAIRPVLMFTKGSPKYRVRLPFWQIADNISRAHLQRDFLRALDHAIRTARR